MMDKDGKNKKIYIIAASALLTAAFVVSLFVGKYRISLERLLVAGSLDRKVFLNLRLSRTLAALVGGFALGMAGSVFQCVFRNPLASPDVIGASSGASVGAAAAILWAGNAAVVVNLSAFLGAMAAVMLAMMLSAVAGKRGNATLLLSGIVINAVFQALLMLMKRSADTENQLAAIDFWLMGSFADVTPEKLGRMALWALPAMAAILLMSRALSMLHLHDDEAAMLGVKVVRLRIAALSTASLLTGAVVSVTGLISFIGLLAPHITRRFTRDGRPGMFALSGLTGALLVVVADVLARSVSASEVPVSVITSLIGAPVLFALLAGQRGREDE